MKNKGDLIMKIVKKILITSLLGLMSLALVSCGEKKIENSTIIKYKHTK